METFKSLVIAIFAIGLIFIISTFGMIYGWGLEPKSWGWVVGSHIGILITSALAQITANKGATK